LSLGIHEELNSQNRMLDDMENDLENATTNLEIVTKKTKDLIKKSGGKRNFMIIVSMCLVVAILLFLILYT
jgi:t-SNARE complex subunit (syntaxin)